MGIFYNFPKHLCFIHLCIMGHECYKQNTFCFLFLKVQWSMEIFQITPWKHLFFFFISLLKQKRKKEEKFRLWRTPKWIKLTIAKNNTQENANQQNKLKQQIKIENKIEIVTIDKRQTCHNHP